MEWLIAIGVGIMGICIIAYRSSKVILKDGQVATDKVVKINEEYFGTDRSRNYLKDDYSRVLRGAIVRSILVGLFVELSKERRNKCELPEGGIAYGDFDPDNAGFFANIFNTYQKGWMIDVRMLLGGKKNKNRGGREAGTGGRFIDEIVHLSTDDFMEYYIKPDSVTVPRCLLGKVIAENPTDSVAFMENNRDVIDSVVDNLIDKTKGFQSKSYHNKIVKDYEALEFHKDNRPDKFSLREEAIDFPFSNGYMTVRSVKSKIEIQEIAKCLNEFAEVIGTYQLLVGKNTNFFGATWPLEVFIERTLDLFVKELPDSAVKKIGEEIVKYLHPSIDIVGWEHKKFARPEVG